MWPKRKVPPFGGTFLLSLKFRVRTSDRPYPAGWDSDPDGSDPAAARASGRRPAAGRASDPASGSAGPVSRSGWTSGSPLLKVTGDNRKTRNWFQGNVGSTGDHLTAAAGYPGLKLALYKPFKPQRALLPHRVPTVKK